MNINFWKNKTVFITGHTGFKGAWISLWLQQLGAKVVGYSLAPPSVPSLFELAHVAQDMTSIEGDIRNLNQLCTTLKDYQPEIVIHMAAQSLVRQSYYDPVETYETNVMGSIYLLEAIRRTKGVKATVNITTDKCYENKEKVWEYSEIDALGGYDDPYSSSKACSELVNFAFRNSFFSSSPSSQQIVGLASARSGNAIGGGDWGKDRLLPDCMRAWLDGKAVQIRYPEYIRPWQHVLEPLSGYLLLAEKLYENDIEYSGAWNFGPEEENVQPVKRILEQLSSYWEGQVSWKIEDHDHPSEPYCVKLDCSKAKKKLGWSPRWNLPTTLKKLVEWYQTYQTNSHQLREKTLEQIHEYMTPSKEL